MVWNSTPTTKELQSQERLDVLLKQDKGDDCLPCRVTGATAFIGLGAYSYFSGHSQLKANQAKLLQNKSLFGMKSRQTGISMISFSLVGLGLYRLFN
ncbi:hypothetical protein PVAG01_03572 [Phlyctema vagabunda]|uniref:Distal membrane-arm assembly complex protein 1-like domain-containing protein n=1 Tax=Phlyctema vagabunda TaxID=108571 RepID=A0ABR4PLR7_9HELO